MSHPPIVLGPLAKLDKVEPVEARLVVASEELVASSASSTTSQVCSVASGAKDTLRFARDFLLSSRLAIASFFARSRAAACCSSSVRTATRCFSLSEDLGCVWAASWTGVDTSSSRAEDVSAAGLRSLAGDRDGLLRPGLGLRDRGGIATSGDKGMVGFSIDFTADRTCYR